MVKENEKHCEGPGDPSIHPRQWGWTRDSEKEGGGGHHVLVMESLTRHSSPLLECGWKKGLEDIPLKCHQRSRITHSNAVSSKSKYPHL